MQLFGDDYAQHGYYATSSSTFRRGDLTNDSDR